MKEESISRSWAMPEKALELLGEGTAHETSRDSVPRGAAEDAVEVR